MSKLTDSSDCYARLKIPLYEHALKFKYILTHLKTGITHEYLENLLCSGVNIIMSHKNFNCMLYLLIESEVLVESNGVIKAGIIAKKQNKIKVMANYFGSATPTGLRLPAMPKENKKRSAYSMVTPVGSCLGPSKKKLKPIKTSGRQVPAGQQSNSTPKKSQNKSDSRQTPSRSNQENLSSSRRSKRMQEILLTFLHMVTDCFGHAIQNLIIDLPQTICHLIDLFQPQ